MKHKFKKTKLILPLTLMSLMGVACIGASTINNVIETKAYNEYIYGNATAVKNALVEAYNEYGTQTNDNLNTEITYTQNNNTYLLNTYKWDRQELMAETFNGVEFTNQYRNEHLYVYEKQIKANNQLTEQQLSTQQSNIVITDIRIYKENTNETIYNYVAEQTGISQSTTPTSGTLGNDIINSIGSGLGLISDLASEFLVGFTALFWNTTNSTLTTFGIFALVMLGIAVSFAVIKLVLNILRSNTGA